jgi:hypothetical protein
MKSPSTSAADEYDRIHRLEEKLIAVPKKEVDQQLASEKASKEHNQRQQDRRPSL